MINNNINNKDIETSHNQLFNDYDMLNDILNNEKNMVKNYATALTESSNDFLYEEFIKVFKDTSDAQKETFNLIYEKGWYVIEKTDDNKKTQKYQEYNTKSDELK
jgi:spore coat protein CotF